MGKKPFFYRCGEGRFEFASEIKAFDGLELIDQEVFNLFEFCFDEHTLYRGIFALRPGHYLIYDPHRGTCHTRCYWDIAHRVGNRITNETVAINTFVELLEDAVRIRLRSDVPVSLFLSGGLDSSLIAALSGIKEVFTCQFEEFRDSINEEVYVRDLANRLGFKVHMVTPTREQFLRSLERMSYHLEMPVGSFSVFPLYCLASACHKQGYKVVLSGEGSDELFAGYARNEFLLEERGRAEGAKQRHYAAMLQRYEGGDLGRFCRMASRSGLAGASLMQAFLANLWSDHRSMLENICYLETRVFLQPLLQMADRMTMAHSLEGRCPFLDHRIVEFAFSLDDSLRFRDGIGKWIVHQAAKRVLPKGAMVLNRQVKDGLAMPVNLWMQGRHSFDRKYWNALMTAECMKSLLQPPKRRHATRLPKPAFTIGAVPAESEQTLWGEPKRIRNESMARTRS
jgi:asparagine synthase (glutamine-hydrolysing)